MAELQEVVISLGRTDVTTHIQSGNVLFTPRPAGRTDTAAPAAELERAIADGIGAGPRRGALPRSLPAARATTRIQVNRIPSCSMRCSCPRYQGPAWPPG